LSNLKKTMKLKVHEAVAQHDSDEREQSKLYKTLKKLSGDEQSQQRKKSHIQRENVHLSDKLKKADGQRSAMQVKLAAANKQLAADENQKQDLWKAAKQLSAEEKAQAQKYQQKMHALEEKVALLSGKLHTNRKQKSKLWRAMQKMSTAQKDDIAKQITTLKNRLVAAQKKMKAAATQHSADAATKKKLWKALTYEVAVATHIKQKMGVGRSSAVLLEAPEVDDTPEEDDDTLTPSKESPMSADMMRLARLLGD